MRRESHDGLRKSLRGFLTLLGVSPTKHVSALLIACSEGNQVIDHKIRKTRKEEHDGVLSTMLAFFSVLSLTSLPDVIRAKDVRRLKLMTKWVLTTWATRSWCDLVAEVKAISLYARCRSLRVPCKQSFRFLLRRFGFGDSRAVLAQVATLARALPPALVPQREQALKDHRVALEADGKAPQTPPDILARLRTYGREFARRFRPGQPLARPWLGPGACLECPRSAGGQLGALAKWEAEWESQPLADELRRQTDVDLHPLVRATLYGPPPDEVARVVADSLYRDAEKLASLSSFDKDTRFSCRRAVVAEPGCKARVVSCHPIREVALAQYLRMIAFSALKSFPETAAVLSGDVLGALKEVFVGLDDSRYVCSADLTNATDFLHQDAAIAVCSAVFEEWGLSDPILERIPALLGVHEFDGWSNYRGILMGSPLSWFTLCLINAFCATEGNLDGNRRVVRICGDDLIAPYTKSEFSRYERLCDSVGFRVNRSKSFMSRDSGVFMERVFSLDFHRETRVDPCPPLGARAGSVQVCWVKDVIPFAVVPAKVFRLSPTRELCWHSIGPALTAAIAGVPINHKRRVLKRVRRLVGMLHPGLAHALYKAGIDAAAPRIIGGAELPWIERFTARSRRLASILASKDLPLKALKEGDGELLLASDVGGAYKMESSCEGADLIRSCALGDVPPSRIIWRPEGLSPDDVVIGNWADIVRDAEMLHGRQLREWGVIPPPKTDALKLSISRVAREVRRRQAVVLSVYPHAPLTHHLYESLQKRFRLEHVFALPYRESMVVTHDAGRLAERQVPCGADVECNRRYYRLLLPTFFTRRNGFGSISGLKADLPGC